MPIDDIRTKELKDIIRNSFRVRKNHDPIYVELSNNLDRISSPQHQLLFGRRGSGKSCLMVHYLNQAKAQHVFPVYIQADTYKKLTYPDILIRVLIDINEAILNGQSLIKRTFNRKSKLRKSIKELRDLLSSPSHAEVSQGSNDSASETIEAEIGKKDFGSSKGNVSKASSSSRTAQFKEQKLELFERQLQDHKMAIEEGIKDLSFDRACILLDDFYLFPRNAHPDIFDYLHRIFRDTDAYLKLATIRHRSTLSRNHPQTVGVELFQDVEEINLDRMLDDVEATQGYLSKMLTSMGNKVNIQNVSESYFNPEALEKLTLASGGVPRDFLNIFVHAIEAAINEASTEWITPKNIWKGASRLTYQTKLKHLREDVDETTPGLERVFVDLLGFALNEKKKTVFLISQEEAQQFPSEHEIIQQLMDVKLIHIVEQDTSAASGRAGRYEAYTLDFSLFMEPRKRNINIVEFWKVGADYHKVGIREAPTYSLKRVQEAFAGTNSQTPEKFMEQLDKESDKTKSATVAAQESLF